MATMNEQTEHDQKSGAQGGHGWMMIICCIPMLAIAAVIAFSTGSLNFLFAAVMCTLMMAMMMGGMSHGSDKS